MSRTHPAAPFMEASTSTSKGQTVSVACLSHRLVILSDTRPVASLSGWLCRRISNDPLSLDQMGLVPSFSVNVSVLAWP
jgi:hypothetical protein